MKKNVDIAENKFRPLKKMMQAAYKEMKWAVERGEFPQSRHIDDLLSYAGIMVSYPGFGDENYDSFLKACQRLHDDFKENDFSAFQQSFTVVKQLRHDCHKQNRFAE